MEQEEQEYEEISNAMKNVTSKTAKYYDRIKRSFNFERSKSKEKVDQT